MHERKMMKIALETVCYTAGAGAFSVFIRWLQTMLAYNEDGLVDASAFNFLLPAILVASALVFRHFVKKFQKERYSISEDLFETMKNEGKLYSVLRWGIGLVMIAGAGALLAECEIDRDAGFLKALAALGVLSGVSFPLLLSDANKPHVAKRGTLCLLSAVPVIFFSFWLVTCYKMNSINPVLWDYSVEIITLIVCILSFFRLAGFAYSVVKPWRTLFLAMLGGALCIMIVADERYMGMQLMYISAAMMQIYMVWVMICNMTQGEKVEEVKSDDGFEHI